MAARTHVVQSREEIRQAWVLMGGAFVLRDIRHLPRQADPAWTGRRLFVGASTKKNVDRPCQVSADCRCMRGKPVTHGGGVSAPLRRVANIAGRREATMAQRAA